MTDTDSDGQHSRRRVLAGGAGVSLGLTSLVLPTAAQAASPGVGGSGSGSWVDTGQFTNGTTGEVFGVTFDGTRFIVGGRDKYFYSAGTDTSSWTEVSTGTSGHDFIHLVSDGTDLVLGDQDSINDPQRVAGAFGGSPTVSSILTGSGSLYFATHITDGPGSFSGMVVGTSDEKFSYSTDGGATWTEATESPFNGGSYLYGLEHDGTTFYALGYNDTKALTATAIGGAWTEVDRNGANVSGFATALALGGGTLVAPISSGVSSGFGIEYSTNGGADWSDSNVDGNFGDPVLKGAIHTGSSFVAFGLTRGVGTTSNVLESSDGQTWTDLSTGDPANDEFSYRSSMAYGGGRLVAVTNLDKVLVYVI